MYRDIVVFNTDLNACVGYEITSTGNRFKGYVNPSVNFYSQDNDGYYHPVKKSKEFVIRKATPKNSIYKRDFPWCAKDEYEYAFTERTSRTVIEDKDVYYNAKKNRFISKSNITDKTRVEYDLPYTIVW